jgi:hypothetical protein
MGSWKDTTTEQKNVMSCVRLAAKLMIITGVNGFFKVEKRLILAKTFGTSNGLDGNGARFSKFLKNWHLF